MEGQVDQAVLAAAEIAGVHEVSHLVHNAGMIWPNLIEDAEPSELTGLTQLHLGSALTLLQACLPSMKKKRFGRVLCLPHSNYTKFWLSVV